MNNKNEMFNYYVALILISFILVLSIFIKEIYFNKNNYLNLVEDINILKINYSELTSYENRYFINSDSAEFDYINYAYEKLQNNFDALPKKLENKRLIFLMNEAEETVIKHKESFYRAVVYFNDTKSNHKKEELFLIELFNLEESQILFKNQHKNFEKSIDKLRTEVSLQYKINRTHDEKRIILILAIFITILTFVLKYFIIWSDKNGNYKNYKKIENKKTEFKCFQLKSNKKNQFKNY